MAAVVTSTVGIPRTQIFSRPPDPYEGPVPVCEMLFSNLTLVPAVGVGDTGQFVYTITLPPTYVYRLLECHCSILGDTVAQVTRWTDGARCLIIENEVTIGSFWLVRENVFGSPGDSGWEFEPGTDLSFGNDYILPGEPTRMILDASTAASITMTAYCPTASTNNAEFRPFFRFAQYTQAQFHAGAIHTSIYTT